MPCNNDVSPKNTKTDDCYRCSMLCSYGNMYNLMKGAARRILGNLLS